MKDNKGFTLVELLAVIVILAIIMIIAIPSVLSTVETAQRKTMLEYYQKVLLAVERKYMEDASFGILPHGGKYQHYIYDIKKDLDITATGSFFGYAWATKSGSKTYFDVFLANDNYMLYATTEKDEEPTTNDLYERSNVDKFWKEASGGAITSLEQVTMDNLVLLVIENTLCDKGNDDYYYETATGREIGHTVYKPENWVSGECKENKLDEFLDSIR